MALKPVLDVTFGERITVSDTDALIRFVEELRKKSVRTFVGEVPLPSGKTVPLNLSFERDPITKRRSEE